MIEPLARQRGNVPWLFVRDSAPVLVDRALFPTLSAFDWRLLGGRIMAVEGNRFLDLLASVAGGPGWRCAAEGDCRRARLRKAGPAPLRTESEPLPLPGTIANDPPVHLGAVDFVPWHTRDPRPTVAIDTLATEGTALVLSHWANQETPASYRADLATESVFAFLDAGAELPSRLLTTDHFDADGALAVFAFAEPDLAMRHRRLLVEAARYGDFRDTACLEGIRLAAVCEGLRRLFVKNVEAPSDSVSRGRVLAACFEAVLSELPRVLRNPAAYGDLWQSEEAHIRATEAEIAQGRLVQLVDPDGDGPVTWIAQRPCPDAGSLPAGTPTYAGWSPQPFHARSRALDVLVLCGHEGTIHQRYESWARLQSRPTAKRADLTAVAAELEIDALKVIDRQKRAPWLLSPHVSFTFDGMSREQAAERVRHALAEAPLGWLPHATSLLPVYGAQTVSHDCAHASGPDVRGSAAGGS